MADLEAAALAAAEQWLQNYAQTLQAIPAGTQHPSAYAVNRCAQCEFTATTIKFCPFCGPEMQHIPPARRCAQCSEQVLYSDARFCGMCGAAL